MSAHVIFLLVTMRATYFFMSIQYHVSSCVAVFGNNLFAIITFIFLVQKQFFVKFGKLDNLSESEPTGTNQKLFVTSAAIS